MTRKTHFAIVPLVSFIIFIATVSCRTDLHDIVEEYSQEQTSLKNMIKSLRHIIEMHPKTNMPHYCAFISSPPDGKPLAMMNMLHLTQRTLVLINTWSNFRGNWTFQDHRNCSECENIMIFSSIADVQKLINEVNVTCTGARINLLVAIGEVLKSDDDAKSSAKTIVDFAWNQIRGYAVVLVSVAGRIVVLKSEGHVPNIRCEPEAPRIVSYWDENGTLMGNLSFDDRFDNKKCVFRIATANCGLLARVVNSSGEETVAGIEGQILQTIAERLNYTTEIIDVMASSGVALSEETISNASRVRQKLESGEADIGACSMWVATRENMKYTYSYSANYVVLMIPIPRYIPFDSILHTFSKSVWICILVSLVIGRVLIRMDHRSISSLMALALFLGVSVASQSRGFVEKWQITLWVIYGYLITQSYIASLASVLNNPWIRKIESIEELAASDTQVAGYGAQSESFKIDEKYKRIVDTYVHMNEPKHTEMMNDPDEILPDPRKTGILVDVLLLHRHDWLSGYYQLKERILNLPLGMAIMSRSRLSLDDIDRTIASLIENGLVPKWTEDEMIPPGSRRISSNIEQPSPTLSLEEVAGIFVILITGLSLSTIVFIFEIYKKKKSQL